MQLLLEEYMKDVAETGSTTTKTKTLHGGVEEDAYFHDVRVSVTLLGCCKLSSQIDCHANQSSIPEWGITALFHYGCLLCIFECTRTSMLQHYEGAVRLLRAQIILESPNAQGREASKLQIPRLRNVLESPNAQGHEASKFQVPRLRNVLESPNAQGHEASKFQISRLKNVLESPNGHKTHALK